MEIELVEENPGQWAYIVGATYQPFDPEQPGNVPMSRERAETLARAELARFAVLTEDAGE